MALELQQFNTKFQHIQGKKNVVADAVSWLRTLGLYQDNDNEDASHSTEDVVKNIIEIHRTEITQKMPTYNVDKLNLMYCKRSSSETGSAKQGEESEDKTRLLTSYWITTAS